MWLGTMSRKAPAVIVVAASLFHAHGFAHGNLHVIDVAPVPDRFENSVGEAEGQNVLDRFFAQVVIDAVNLLFVHHLQQLLIQRSRRIQVAAKGLFDNHPAPLMILFRHQADSGQMLHDGTKEIRRGGEIVKVIAVGGVVLVDFLQQFLQLLVSALVGKFAGDVEHVPLKPLLQIGIDAGRPQIP